MTLVLPDAPGATRLILVRHAEPEETAAGRCYGRLDVALSGRGRRQAQELGRQLASLPLAAAYSSPLRRALETASPLAAAHGLSPIVLDDLRELDFGEVEGMRYEDIAAERPALFRTWMDHPAEVRFPGGESLADLRRRALRVVGEIRIRHEGATAAVVTHGGVVRVVLGDALGISDGAVFRLDQAYGAVSVVDWVGGTPVVRAVNVAYTRAR